MNTIAKVSVAGALALGFGVAHASILYPASGGDILLFAEVLNGTSVVGSYAGDTGVLIGNPIPASLITKAGDSNLQSLLNLATGTNTIEWAVEGGKVTKNGVWTGTDQYVTTIGPQGSAQLALRTGANTTNWSTGLTQDIAKIDSANGGTSSIFSTSASTGGQFDVSQPTNISNWYGNGTLTAQTGLGSTTLYGVGMGSTQGTFITLSSLGQVTLGANGLTFASGGGTTVPVPAAVWLLGSGLLGLAGIGRRKLAAV